MDFDDFDDGPINEAQITQNASPGVSEALKLFDRVWYVPRSRASRRMDLLGDYAGNEFFVIDGAYLAASVPAM